METIHPAKKAAFEAAVAADHPIALRSVPALVERDHGIPRPHISTIQRWRLRGVGGYLLPTFLVGGRRYVKPSDLRAFMQKINGVSVPEPQHAA